MANDINRVIISGRATRDAELRRTQGGMAIMSFGIAVNDRRKNPQTGEWEDVAGFYDCTMFGNRAESLSSFIAKGMQLMVEGKLRYSKWERDGVTKSKVEIIAEEVVLPPRQNGSGGGYGAQSQQAGGYAYGNGSAPQTAPQQGNGGGYQQGGYQQHAQPQAQPSGQQGYQQQAPQQAPQQTPQQMVQSAFPGTRVIDMYADEDIPF